MSPTSMVKCSMLEIHKTYILDTEQLTVPVDHTEQEQEDAQEEEDGNDTEEENQQIVVVDEDTAHLIHQGYKRFFLPLLKWGGVFFRLFYYFMKM